MCASLCPVKRVCSVNIRTIGTSLCWLSAFSGRNLLLGCTGFPFAEKTGAEFVGACETALTVQTAEQIKLGDRAVDMHIRAQALFTSNGIDDV